MGIPSGLRVTWNGHSCFELVTPGGTTVVLDPFFANPNSPKTADAVAACDLLLVSHGHFDHMGDAVAIAARLRPAWPCIHEMSLWLARQLPGGSDQVIGMNKGGTVEAAGLRISMTTADHSAGDWNAAGETTLYLGDPVGFVLELEDGARVYFAGDTDLFDGMRELGPVDLALIPIWGWGPGLGAGHLDPARAADAVALVRPRVVVPIHWGTYFPIHLGMRRQPGFVKLPPAQFLAALEKAAPDVEARVLAPGEGTEL